MLARLRIRDFAIIEEAELEFGPGLNVLTGETGAGKTIILNALGLLLGSRGSPEMLRTGSAQAIVEGVFEIEGETPTPETVQSVRRSDDAELIVRRSISESGRSRALVGGSTVTVASLGALGSGLVQVYGQHEQQSLLRSESHREVIDRFAGLDAPLAAYCDLYQQAQQIQRRLDDLERRGRERADLLELARFRVAELERADLHPGEDEDLAGERTVLANASKLKSAALESHQILYGSEGAAAESLAKAAMIVEQCTALDSSLDEVRKMIEEARTNLEEAARELEGYADRIEADPARLEEIEDRLQEISRLKRKYGGTVEAAIETLDRSREEIADLQRTGESKAEADAKLADVLDELAERARKLSAMRRKGAQQLKRRAEAELRTLGMRAPVFEARIGPLDPTQAGFVRDGIPLGPAGADAVEFYFSPNLGEPPLPLMKIASGGELSRVMLALKRLEAQRRGVATMIFDEVDAGIGGAVATVVGRKLRELARYHQVMCVTHLAQIAAFADRHFVVEKEERRGTTRSRVIRLRPEDRVAEMARMLGGDEASGKFLRAARELLERAA